MLFVASSFGLLYPCEFNIANKTDPGRKLEGLPPFLLPSLCYSGKRLCASVKLDLKTVCCLRSVANDPIAVHIAKSTIRTRYACNQIGYVVTQPCDYERLKQNINKSDPATVSQLQKPFWGNADQS